MQNELGQRGEQLFSVIITRFYGRTQPIFRPQFLGDKWPTSDFLVELIGNMLTTIPYFFVQVKTTRLGYDGQNRLRIQVTAIEMQKLNVLPAPTYVIGIDDITEQGYIICAKREYPGSINGLTTAYPLNEQNQNILWLEVKNYWDGLSALRVNSYFVDEDRK
jgi:hypothetical protein